MACLLSNETASLLEPESYSSQLSLAAVSVMAYRLLTTCRRNMASHTSGRRSDRVVLRMMTVRRSAELGASLRTSKE
jgi:hypothetical protein